MRQAGTAAPERAATVPSRCFKGCITSSDFLSQKPLADWGNKLDVGWCGMVGQCLQINSKVYF